MTFNEYINQEDPQRQEVGSVLIDIELHKDLVHVSSPIVSRFAGKTTETREVWIRYKNKWLSYRTDTGDNGLLWTIDKDGNKKNRSVFRIKL